MPLQDLSEFERQKVFEAVESILRHDLHGRLDAFAAWFALSGDQLRSLISAWPAWNDGASWDAAEGRTTRSAINNSLVFWSERRQEVPPDARPPLTAAEARDLLFRWSRGFFDSDRAWREAMR